MEIVVFNYDKDFVADHMNAANSFFISFIWRFVFVNTVISILPMFGVVLLSLENSSDFPFLITFIVSLFTSFAAIFVSFWMIRKNTFKDKKNNQMTSIVFHTRSKLALSERSLLLRVSFDLFWKSCVVLIPLYLIAFILSNVMNFNLLLGSPAMIIGFMSFYIGWHWFALFNDRKSAFIDFVVTETNAD